MATVRVEWDPTPTDMPIDTPDLDHYDIHLGALAEIAEADESFVDFLDVAPGDYIPTAQAMDEDDNPIGPLFQGASIHVPEPPVKSILLPANVRASIL